MTQAEAQKTTLAAWIKVEMDDGFYYYQLDSHGNLIWTDNQLIPKYIDNYSYLLNRKENLEYQILVSY